MKVVLLSIVVVALCVLLLCFNILRHREFPQFDVGGNEELGKRGIRCFKDEDAALHSRTCDGEGDGCGECDFKRN